ncbi:MAG: histidinol-phosphate transaminase [Candidatus Micrarchaeota archaeon]
MKQKSFVREGVRQLAPYVCARDLYKEAEIFMDANENAFGSTAEFKGVPLNRYPDSDAIALRKALAEYLGETLSPDNVLVGNGSDEIIDLCIRACAERGDNIVCVEPGYSMFDVCASVEGVNVKRVRVEANLQPDVAKVLAAVDGRTRMIVVVSPNSPLGNVVDESRIREIARQAPCTVFVDEAYGEFAERTLAALVLEYPNLVVSKTLSKAWGLAGIRVGYVAADASFINGIRRIKPPYNVNAISMSVALEALKNKEKMVQYLRLMREEKGVLEAKLRNRGLEVFDTKTNFTVFRLPIKWKSKEIQRSIAAKGIIVRDRSSIPLMDNCIRITIGTSEENRRLLAELDEVLDS